MIQHKPENVYAATREIYAVIFAAIKLMNPLIPPKLLGIKKYEESNLMSDLRLIERQLGDLDKIKGKKVSIYVLDDKNIFVENLWDKEKNDFNIDIINEYSNYIKNKRIK